MATKKEKRAKALADREKFMAQYRADGLAALKADQERRKREVEETKAKEEAINKELLKRRGKPFARMAKKEQGIDLTRNLPEDVTVGEYLNAANKLLPVFSN